MLNEPEAQKLICKKVPGIALEIIHGQPQDIYKITRYFTDYTNQQLKGGDMEEAITCFDVAQELLIDGSKTVVLAIENVFVYSIANLVESRGGSAYLKDMFHFAFGAQYTRLISAHYP